MGLPEHARGLPGKLGLVALIVLLLAFHAYVARVMTQPAVGEAYRAYYLDRRNVSWATMQALEQAPAYRLGDWIEPAAPRWDAYRTLGWSDQALSWGRAARGRTGVVLPLPARETPLDLVVEGMAIATATSPASAVEVLVNDRQVGVLALDARALRAQRFELPAATMAGRRYVFIEFQVPGQQRTTGRRGEETYGISRLVLREPDSAP